MKVYEFGAENAPALLLLPLIHPKGWARLVKSIALGGIYG